MLPAPFDPEHAHLSGSDDALPLIEPVVVAKLPPTHIAVADESGYNRGRYRGISVVSFPITEEVRLQEALRRILAKYEKKEIKWHDIAGRRNKAAAREVIELVVEEAAAAGRLRVDTLLWDTHDHGHAVAQNDALSLLSRRYTVLFRTLMQKRWPAYAIWDLRPDEQTAIQWDRIEFYLGAGDGLGRKGQRRFKSFLPEDLRYRVARIWPSRSHEEPFINIADIFAGMGVFSRESYPQQPFSSQTGPRQVKLGESRPPTLTNRVRERLNLLHEFRAMAKQKGLRIRFQDQQCFSTLPDEPLNFWWWESRSTTRATYKGLPQARLSR